MYMKMKKIIIIFLLFISINFVFADINSDLNYLQKILEQCYVNYDEECKAGFQIDNMEKKVNKYYDYLLKKNSNISDLSDKESVFLCYAISWGLNDCFTIKNGHLKTKYKDTACPVFSLERSYYTNIYLEKKDDKFIVFESKNNSVKKGDEYKDDKNYIKECIYKNKKLYQIIISSKEDITQKKLKFNRKKISIPCSLNTYQNDKYFFKYYNTNKSFYISIKSCPYIYDVTKNYQEEFNKLCKEIEKNYFEHLIIDLRGNTGGYSCFEYILPRLMCKDYENCNFDYYYNQAMLGTIKLISPVYLQSIVRYYEENFPNNSELINSAKSDYEHNSINHKYYTGSISPALSKLPQIPSDRFNGKIFILIDKATASEAENGIALAYLFGKEKIVLVGENTRGCFEVQNNIEYTLPNSKIHIYLGNKSTKKSTLLQSNPKWKGELIGFEPDYWANDEQILETLKYLTNDYELENLRF